MSNVCRPKKDLILLQGAILIAIASSSLFASEPKVDSPYNIYLSMVKLFRNDLGIDSVSTSNDSVDVFLDVSSDQQVRVNAAISFASRKSIGNLPIEKILNIAKDKDETDTMRSLSVLLITKGMLTEATRSEAEGSLFRLLRDSSGSEAVKQAAIANLWLFSSSPNAVAREFVKILSSSEASSESIGSIGEVVCGMALDCKSQSLDILTNCFLAAFSEDDSEDKRFALVKLMALIESHHRSSECLHEQTVRDIHDLAQREFCRESDSESYRLFVATLINRKLSISEETGKAAQKISDDSTIVDELREYARKILRIP